MGERDVGVNEEKKRNGMCEQWREGEILGLFKDGRVQKKQDIRKHEKKSKVTIQQSKTSKNNLISLTLTGKKHILRLAGKY